MKLSRSELSALTLKAGRGAGVPLSQAIEASQVIAATDQEDLSETLAAFLYALNQTRCHPEGTQRNGIWTMSSDDLMQAIPAALDLAQAGEQVIALPGHFSDQWSRHRGFVPVSEGVLAPGPEREPAKGHADLSADHFKALNALAQHTYVPSTEASRSGAGAGDIDNE